MRIVLTWRSGAPVYDACDGFDIKYDGESLRFGGRHRRGLRLQNR